MVDEDELSKLLRSSGRVREAKLEHIEREFVTILAHDYFDEMGNALEGGSPQWIYKTT